MISPLSQLNAVHLSPVLVTRGGCTKIAVSQKLGGHVHEIYHQRKGCFFFKPLPEPSVSFCYSRIHDQEGILCSQPYLYTEHQELSETHAAGEASLGSSHHLSSDSIASLNDHWLTKGRQSTTVALYSASCLTLLFLT